MTRFVTGGFTLVGIAVAATFSFSSLGSLASAQTPYLVEDIYNARNPYYGYLPGFCEAITPSR